jgi:hypothetical protein
MKRTTWSAALLAALAAEVALGGVQAQRQEPPKTPAALRQFNGVLYGEVVRTEESPRFTGLVLNLALAEAAPGSEPVDLARVANVQVSILLPAGKDGRPLSPALGQALRSLRPHQPVRVETRAAGPDHALYARQIESISSPLPQGALTPARVAPQVAVPGDAPDVQQLSQQLQSLRRELARLQQDVADLRAQAKELSGRVRSK